MSTLPPPGYNPRRPRPGMQQPRQQGLMGFPRPGIPPQGFPVGPRQIQQPGMQQQGPIGLPKKPIFLPRPDGTLQNMHPAAGGIRPGVQPSGYSQYGPRGFGPMQGQGVGDPRLGAPMIPGNQAQMMMRGPQQSPMQQLIKQQQGVPPAEFNSMLQLPRRPIYIG